MGVPSLPSNSIFISYRRSDSNDVTGRIYDRLSNHFGRDIVFKDVDSIPSGVDFRTYLNQGAGNCRVLIAVIGSTWLTVSDAHGKRRLDDPDDWVRAEIEIALRRGIPVIPLLVGGASPPGVEELPEALKQLSYQNAAQSRPDPDFHKDLDRLIQRLEEIVGIPESLVRPSQTTPSVSVPDAQTNQSTSSSKAVIPPPEFSKDGTGVLSPDQIERQALEKEYVKLTAKYEGLSEQIEGELNEDNKDTLYSRRNTIKRKMNEIWNRLHGNRDRTPN